MDRHQELVLLVQPTLVVVVAVAVPTHSQVAQVDRVL
jgi:hypothetical protein